MGIYGGYARALAEAQQNKPNIDIEPVVSVVYEEYLNRKSMLENCTDTNMIPVLEAQVNVLYEVSLKDIKDKVIEIINAFIDWVKKIIKKVKDFITGAKYKAAQDEIEQLKKEIDINKVKNMNLEKEIERLKKEQEAKDKANEEEKEHIRNAVDLSVEKLEKIKEKIKEPNPIMFFDAHNYLNRSFSPQRLASNAYNIMQSLNTGYGDKSAKDRIKDFLDEYEKYLYILNDKTKERLGEDSELRYGGIDHAALYSICKSDMEKEAEKFKNVSLGDLYDEIKVTNTIASTDWLVEIMDGYEIFAQNLMKAVEKEFKVQYTQNVGNASGVSPDVNNDLDKYKEVKENFNSDELAQRANTAIKLCKASVSACGTFIKFNGEMLGARRELMRTIKILTDNA